MSCFSYYPQMTPIFADNFAWQPTPCRFFAVILRCQGLKNKLDKWYGMSFYRFPDRYNRYNRFNGFLCGMDNIKLFIKLFGFVDSQGIMQQWW